MALLVCLAQLLLCSARAQDTTGIQIRLNRLSFNPKDMIEFECKIPGYSAKKMAAVTLNVWIQDVESKQTWKFRYPVLNGQVNCGLNIGDSIRPGRYAINFILQQGLFRIHANAKNAHTNALSYMVLFKDKQSMFKTVNLDEDGNFLIKNLLFEDHALFIFSPNEKKKKNELVIDIATPLDSFFVPIAVFTRLIDVKPGIPGFKVPADSSYSFDYVKTYTNTTLPEVVVFSKGKKKVEDYEKSYVTGLFKSDNARVFDGLNSDEISSYLDIATFLQAKIPGLVVERDNFDRMIWRNEVVTVYVDEYKLESQEAIPVYPSEVAMIKVFDPPASVNLGGGFGGAVVIYTKKGAYNDNNNRKFKFTLKGYNALESTWR